MSGGQFATSVTDSFTTTGESADKTGKLNTLIDAMFGIRMPEVEVSTVNASGQKDKVNTSSFYSPTGGSEYFVALGSVEHPYDIWYYYNRKRFKLYYMVASRNSTSGEYEIGEHETIYGQNMQRYNLDLNLTDDPDQTAARMYSNDDWFKEKDYWTPSDNSSLAPAGSSRPSNGLNDKTAEGYTRLCPDGAAEGMGKWTCKYWSLDRSGSGVMEESDWNRMVTGNLRVFAQWTPPMYRVKFDFNGGSYNNSETFGIQTVKANVGYTSSGNSIPSPTKDGYIFNGWKWYAGEPDGDGLKPVGEPLDFTFEKPITRDIVLVAQWIPSARTSYNYKIWYLTDETPADSEGLPKGEGWLTESDNRGTPQPDSQHAGYTHVLGCQYVEGKIFPENTVLSLAAVAIPGYAPVRISTTLSLNKDEDDAGAADTVNVAYFYYRKSRLRTRRTRLLIRKSRPPIRRSCLQSCRTPIFRMPRNGLPF